MTPTSVTLRPAMIEDAASIAAIFGHYVTHTVISFQETAPSTADWAQRIDTAAAEAMPFLVAETTGGVVGYAYASPWKTYAGYRHTIEDSVYVDHAHVGRGVGRALLEALIRECRSAGYEQMIAVISLTPNVGTASIELHRRLGFGDVGTLRKVGSKHGHRIDTHVMQLEL
ncbi:MAG TPA: GNAT family N-acetyltransferase [Acidimicrobiia bacterium]|nr:GNAT family N-acetyltransferase [Acidimicrobiia bacterium]